MTIAGVSPGAIAAMMVTQVGSHVVWANVIFKVVRRYRMVGWRVYAFCVTATILVSCLILFGWCGWLLTQARVFGIYHIPRGPLFVMLGMLMGVCMGAGFPAINAEKRNKEEEKTEKGLRPDENR